ncbi:hypothetical protein GTY83_07100 [Streptomyces sp. SID4928]|uniref:GIY-YIG nuclease family protein n=1 Tax=unclassified Streptomyces TaxID=2593676 RepID=UPI0001C1C99B|nr:GIY-YIG nuclease family protein [Streptomyces sp. ACT-1]EGE40801.1 hypothetical protein SACT1_1436 [Streptomyces sp. ACT-1]MYR48872.1 hypothetical protein [Streptomyces sp. SID4928]
MTHEHGPSLRIRRVNAQGAVRYHDQADASAVYRVYNDQHDLIYVGMSYEPDARVRVQRREKPWGHEIAYYEADWHPDRAACQRAERALIESRQPRYNVTYTPEHQRRSLLHLGAQQIAEGRTTGKRADIKTKADPGSTA